VQEFGWHYHIVDITEMMPINFLGSEFWITGTLHFLGGLVYKILTKKHLKKFGGLKLLYYLRILT
jgi:hypothetical protein